MDKSFIYCSVCSLPRLDSHLTSILMAGQNVILQQFIKESPCELEDEVFQTMLQRYDRLELYTLIKEGRENMNLVFNKIELEIKQMHARNE